MDPEDDYGINSFLIDNFLLLLFGLKCLRQLIHFITNIDQIKIVTRLYNGFN